MQIDKVELFAVLEDFDGAAQVDLVFVHAVEGGGVGDATLYADALPPAHLRVFLVFGEVLEQLREGHF